MTGIAEVQGSHTDTLVEVIRGLSNPVHPAQMLILSWKAREESPTGSSNDKIPIREYVLQQSHTRLDPKQINDLVVAYQAGSTVKELAAKFQIHHTTVSNVLERHGVPRRYRPMTPEQIEDAIQAYQAGGSSKMIGGLLGVDASTVWRTLRREGVEIRNSRARQR
ncbi:MAG: hypothetical protein M0T78_12320 [Actinomycetota bacterium]|nr:hypothetical protein [Actinomycetota bacterium]